MAEKFDYNNIPKEKFSFASREGSLKDKKLETKPVGYLKDAWMRFRKNTSSIIGAIIVICVIIFAIVSPFCFSSEYQKSYTSNGVDLQRYKHLLPKLPFVEVGSGFWDVCYGY